MPATVAYKITGESLTRNEVSLGVKRIEPTSGARMLAEDYFNYAVNGYNLTGKLLSPSEVGCTLSHLSIYKRIVVDRKPAIIFESDIDIQKQDLSLAISICESSDVNFVHLGWHPNIYYGGYFRVRPVKDKPIWQADHLNAFYGSFAYYITPELANALITFHETSLKRADAWAHFFNKSNYKAYFFGIFWHPKDRGQLASERVRVSGKVYNVDKLSILNYLSILFRQKLLRADPRYKPCKPAEI